MAGEGSPKGFKNNMESIRKVCENKCIYVFENEFKRSDKIAVGKLETFILDREDVTLKANLRGICKEFERKVEN